MTLPVCLASVETDDPDELTRIFHLFPVEDKKNIITSFNQQTQFYHKNFLKPKYTPLY